MRKKLELGLATLNHRADISRCFSLCLALFIFTVTAFVHLTHSKADFQSVACEQASYCLNDAGAQPICLACMIVKTFQTAQVILFFLFFYIVAASGFHRSWKSKLHSVSFFTSQWVRGPPSLASSF